MLWMERFARWFAFNLWYFKRPPWDTGISPPELMDFIHRHPAGRALDLGCGSGTNLLTLAKVGWQVVGIDMSFLAVWYARQRLRKEKVNGQVLMGSVTNLSRISPPFDLILDIGCYHGLPQVDRALYQQNLLHYLATSGTFLVYAHLKDEEQNQMTGISREEIEMFNGLFTPVRVQESQDRWGRVVIWLEYAR